MKYNMYKTYKEGIEALKQAKKRNDKYVITWDVDETWRGEGNWTGERIAVRNVR